MLSIGGSILTTDMTEWLEVNIQGIDTSKLRAEFLEEKPEPKTPAEGSQVIELEDDVAEQATEEVAPKVIVYVVAPPSPPV